MPKNSTTIASSSSSSCELVAVPENEQAPIVGSFRTTVPMMFQEEMNKRPHKRELSFEVFNSTSRSSKKKKQRILLTHTDKMVYQGVNFAHHKPSLNFQNYAVGVYNKQSGKVEMHALDHIYVLQPSIQSRLTSTSTAQQEDTDEEQPEAEAVGVSKYDQRKALVNAFGNKASKRIVKNVEENRLNPSNIAGSKAVHRVLEEKMQAMEQPSTTSSTSGKSTSGAATKSKEGESVDARALDATRRAMLPPFNADAVKQDEVYDPESFLDVDHVEALVLQAQYFMDQIKDNSVRNFTSTHSISGFVETSLVQVSQHHPEQHVKKIGYIFYLHYLILLFRQRFPVRKSPTEFSTSLNIPPIVLQQLLAVFSDANHQNGRLVFTQSKTLKDKLLIYILMMALVIRNYTLDLQELAQDLKRSPATLGPYCRELGCRMDRVKTGPTKCFRAVLAVPLRFPAPKSGGKRGRK